MTSHRPLVPASMTGPAERMAYSPGVVAGNLVFVSGQIGRDASGNVPEGREQQFLVAFENVLAVLTEAGAGFDDVVDMTTFHTDIADVALFAELKARFFTRPPYPAWTAVGVTELALPGVRLEIKVVAVLPG